MEGGENRELLMQLELCGHFLHHRGGGGHGQARILRILRENGQLAQKQLQEMLHIGRTKIYQLIKSGTLPCRKSGGNYFIRKIDVIRFLEKQA